MLHTWKPQLKRCYSLIEPSATSTSTRLFNWIFLSCQRDRHPFYACCVWLLVFCTFARFHGICLGNKVARARIKVMNGFPRGPTTTSILVTSSSIQKWIWPGLLIPKICCLKFIFSRSPVIQNLRYHRKLEKKIGVRPTSRPGLNVNEVFVAAEKYTHPQQLRTVCVCCRGGH